jgi:hypothetical protein
MTRWTEFVREYADKHNIGYGCAMEKAANAYHEKYGTKPKPKSPEKFKKMIKQANSVADQLEKKIEEKKQEKKVFNTTLRNIKSGVEKRKEFAKRYLDSNIPP